LLKFPFDDGELGYFSIDPDAWPERYRKRVESHGQSHVNLNGDPPWLVNPDDRSFTHTALFLSGMPESTVGDETAKGEEDKEWSKLIADGFEQTSDKPPTHAGYWVKHLNVDLPGCIQAGENCSRFEYDWAMERTYKRWLHYGSLYGFTSHSTALMAGGKDQSEKPLGDPPLGKHMAGVYFDSTLLLLYLRVTLFRFSRELHEVSCAAKDQSIGHELNTWREKFVRLRWQFLLFENLYQFPLLSNQQQHLEMYELQRRWMDIRELYEEISKEIQSSDTVLENISNERRADLSETLNWIAAIGLIFGILLSGAQVFFGQDTFSGIIGVPQMWALSLCIVSIVAFIAVALHAYLNRRADR
jgi:hypothetical protein